jgi:hypothetical protein
MAHLVLGAHDEQDGGRRPARVVGAGGIADFRGTCGRETEAGAIVHRCGVRHQARLGALERRAPGPCERDGRRGDRADGEEEADADCFVEVGVAQTDRYERRRQRQGHEAEWSPACRSHDEASSRSTSILGFDSAVLHHCFEL